LNPVLYGLYGLGRKRLERKGVEQARNELPKLIEAAEAGNVTVITKRGRPIAALVPLDAHSAAPRQRSLLALAGTGPKLWGRNSGRTIAELRDEWSR
jgi:prevent-host-death family protein